MPGFYRDTSPRNRFMKIHRSRKILKSLDQDFEDVCEDDVDSAKFTVPCGLSAVRPRPARPSKYRREGEQVNQKRALAPEVLPDLKPKYRHDLRPTAPRSRPFSPYQLTWTSAVVLMLPSPFDPIKYCIPRSNHRRRATDRYSTRLLNYFIQQQVRTYPHRAS